MDMFKLELDNELKLKLEEMKEVLAGITGAPSEETNVSCGGVCMNTCSQECQSSCTGTCVNISSYNAAGEIIPIWWYLM